MTMIITVMHHDHHHMNTIIMKSINQKFFAIKNIPLSDVYINPHRNRLLDGFAGMDLIFDAVEADKWLNRLARIPGSLRTKAVLRTNEGWWKFNFVSQAETLKPSGYRRDSRIEVIMEGPCDQLVDQFEQELKACLVNEPITS